MCVIEVTEFQDVLPYLRLLEDKNLTVIVSGNETILGEMGNDSYIDLGEVNYFNQSVATNNLFTPVFLNNHFQFLANFQIKLQSSRGQGIIA